MKYFIVDGQGRPLAKGDCPENAVQAQLSLYEGAVLCLGEIDLDGEYYLDGEVKVRPSLSVPTTEGQAPFIFDLSSFAGSEIVVRNETGEEMELTGEETVTLSDAGAYQFEVTPPFPYLSCNFEVVVQ